MDHRLAKDAPVVALSFQAPTSIDVEHVHDEVMFDPDTGRCATPMGPPILRLKEVRLVVPLEPVIKSLGKQGYIVLKVEDMLTALEAQGYTALRKETV